MMDKLRITHFIEHTGVLGPFDRSALWVHGCCFSCEGCLARDMNSGGKTEYEVDRLANIFSDIEGTEGITISGGEPFLQAEVLSKMIIKIRQKRDYGVIIYSGFTYEELCESNKKGVQDLLELADLLIDGQYVKELDDGKPYRGSANQRFILLSDRYNSAMTDYFTATDKRNIEIRLTKEKVYLIGVPSENGLNTWKKFRAKAVISHE